MKGALARDSIEIVVQVNGKVRARLEAPCRCRPRHTVEALASAFTAERRSHFLEGLTVRKVIVVPGKLINIVAN